MQIEFRLYKFMLIRPVILAAALFLHGCYTPPDLTPPPSVSGNYVLDPEHTSIIWIVSHIGLSNFTGRFDQIEGQLAFDGQNPAASQLDIRIQSKSVNTGLPDFDQTLASGAKYFDSENHPEIRFLATDINVTGPNTGIITGDLMFRGETHPLHLDVTFNGAGKSFGHPGDTLGFSATGTLDRSNWGLTTLKNFGIGEVVTLQIETEFNEAR